jgi:hypothetical protein
MTPGTLTVNSERAGSSDNRGTFPSEAAQRPIGQLEAATQPTRQLHYEYEISEVEDEMVNR